MTEQQHIELPAPTLAACLEALRYLCSTGRFQYVPTDEMIKFFREHSNVWKPFTDASAFSFILMLLKSLQAQNLVIYVNDQGWRPLEFEAAPPGTVPELENVCSTLEKTEEQQQIVETKKTSRRSKRKEVPSKRIAISQKEDSIEIRSQPIRKKEAVAKRITISQKDDSEKGSAQPAVREKKVVAKRITILQKDNSEGIRSKPVQKEKVVAKRITISQKDDSEEISTELAVREKATKVVKTMPKKSERKKKIQADLIDISLPTLGTCLEALRYLCLKQSKPVLTVDVSEFFLKQCKTWKPRNEPTGEAFIDKLLRSLISHGLVVFYRNAGWYPEEFRDFKPEFLKDLEISDMTSNANVQEAPTV